MTLSDKGLSFVHINARSIFRKIHEIEHMYSNVDFLFLVEQISGKIVGLTIKASKLPKL